MVKLLSWAILCAIVRAELENQFAGQTRKSEAERFWGGGGRRRHYNNHICDDVSFGILEYSHHSHLQLLLPHTQTQRSVFMHCVVVYFWFCWIVASERKHARALFPASAITNHCLIAICFATLIFFSLSVLSFHHVGRFLIRLMKYFGNNSEE